MTTNASNNHKLPRKPAFWITMFRAALAIVLGAVLIFQPEKTRPLLINFMGMFWLAGGLASLRMGASGRRGRRLAIFVGVIGVLAGLVTVARHQMTGFFDESVVIYLLGAVIFLTGVSHIIIGVLEGKGFRLRLWTNLIGGIFEVVLGAMVLISPFSYGPVVYFAIIVWAFLGGFVLFMQAWRSRKQDHQEAIIVQEK